jgi:hypothetical protein
MGNGTYKWEGWDLVRPRLLSIPASVRTQLIPVMEQGAEQITNLQRGLVHVEKPPGAHADGSAHEKAHGPGTEKQSIGWFWKGTAIIISAIPRVLPNLGLWLERGTRAGRRGDSYRALMRRKGKNGRIRTYVGARKIYRTHPGSNAFPFFFPGWLAEIGPLKDRMIAAWRSGIDSSIGH